jgi:hypothetical protein
MKSLLGSLLGFCLVGLAGWYTWTHRQQMVATAVPAQVRSAQPKSAEEQQAGKLITIAGPLADLVTGQNGDKSEESEASRDVVHSDHVGGSPVGTSSPILHRTFKVAAAVDLPFQVPAHAANAQLHGTFHSFVQGTSAASDDAANVEFLLLDEQQYADFLGGRPGEALFATDEGHDGEVNFSLPLTLDRPATYYLVFRNSSPATGKKLVQADFRVDF